MVSQQQVSRTKFPDLEKSSAVPNGIVGYEDCIRNIYAENTSKAIVASFEDLFKRDGHIVLSQETFNILIRLAVAGGVSVGQLQIKPFNNKD